MNELTVLIDEIISSCEIEDIHINRSDISHYMNNPDLISNEKIQLFSNYMNAITNMFNEIKRDPFFSVEMILKAHETLMFNSNQKYKPGKFRDELVRIGKFIPPVPDTIASSMEKLVHSMNSALPMNIAEIGILHAQFEFIHPFLDGNGRLGRILIMIMLVRNCIIKSLNISPSKFINKDRNRYFQELDNISLRNNNRDYAINGFESWNIYFNEIISDSLLELKNN